MRPSAAFCVTVVLALGLVTAKAWAGTADDETMWVPTYTEPAAESAFDADNPAMAVQPPEGPPAEADSDCLVVIRHTHLSDAEHQIDPEESRAWIATDAERKVPEKCRAIGAR